MSSAKQIEPTAQEGGWLDTYLNLKATGLHWKKAAFVAWYTAPKKTRKPGNQEELAELLNYKTADTFRKWRFQSWFKELGIDRFRESIFLEHLAEVDRRTIEAAETEKGRDGVQARKLFYELESRYRPTKTADNELEADWWAAVDDDPA